MVLNKEITVQITDLLRVHPQGLSITDIVKKIGLNRNTAGRYLENLLISGQVEMRHFGMAKIYTLSNRIPQLSMLSISSDLVMQLDSGLRIVFINEPFLNILRVTATDLLGKNIEFSAAVQVFGDSFEDFITILKTGISGKEWHGTLALNKGDLFFSCHITPMVFNDGRKGVSVRLEDLTELRRRENALQESEARLRSIISAAPVGIGVVSDRVILEVNNRLCQMTGYSTSELIGKSARILYPTDDDFERVGREKYSMIARTGTGTVQTQWKKKDGSFIDILLSSSPISPADLTRGVTFTALDITERTRAERALSESEERYRKLVEISPDAVILHRDGKIIYVNPAAQTLVGALRHEEMVGKLILDFVDPRFREVVSENIKKDIDGELSPYTELQMLRLDGTSVSVEGRGVKTHIDGKPAVLVAIRDITEYKRAELAIRDSEEKFRSLFNNTNDMILVHSLTSDGHSGHYIEVNDVACRSLKYTREEFLRMLPQDLVAPEVLSTARKNGRLLLTNGDVTTESVLRSKDDRIIPVEINAHLFEFRGQTLVLAIIRDITERQQAREKLQESERKYRFLAENSLDIINRQTPECILTYVSPVVTPVLGYSEEEVLGRSLLEMVHPDDIDRVRQDMVRISACGVNKVISTFRFRHRDGHYLWFESITNVIRDPQSGKIREFFSISRDITERKMLEGSLNARAER
ncbi:MAG: PAS domain S-box protein [Methanoregula sp.]